MTTAAFFDLDGTLISVNSGALWMQRERSLGRLSTVQVLEATVMLLAYRLSVVDMERAMRRALAVYKGVKEADLARWTREWYTAEVAPRVAPGARAALDAHRAQGDQLVLLTSSSPYISQAAAEHLGLDAWICSRYVVEKGVLTGEPVPPICFGEGKITWAERFAREHDIDLDSSPFYSDSYTDLPMLQRVGKPRVVNPDLRLYLAARRRRWPILDWRDHAAARVA